jgi:MFS family permease
VVASILGGQLLSRTGRYRAQAVGGIALIGAGILLATRLGATSGQGDVTPAMVVLGLGMGLSMPVFNVVSQNAVPQRLMSSATSGIQFIRQMGATLGLAAAGSYFNSRLAAQGGSGRVALAGAIHDVFLLSLLGCVVTLVLAACIREIPLRRTARDRAEAPAEAVAA